MYNTSMHIIEQLRVNDDFTTTLEITGPRNATECIVFSHGFGVARDARGLFTDIEQDYFSEYACVRFDYATHLENGDTKIGSFQTMKDTLEAVIVRTQELYSPLTLHVIAHSLGGLVAMTQTDQFDGHAIMLAPSVTPVGSKLQNYFLEKEGTTVNVDGVMIAKRSDGTSTYISGNFWKELGVYAPLEVYANVASDLHVLQAKQDEIITNHPELIKKIPQVIFSEINGNHDFTGESRMQVRQYIRDIFYGK